MDSRLRGNDNTKPNCQKRASQASGYIKNKLKEMNYYLV